MFSNCPSASQPRRDIRWLIKYAGRLARFAPISVKLGASVDTRPIFVSKLSDAESEAGETRVWLEFALRCQYLEKDQFDELDHIYDNIIGRLVRMLSEPEQWTIR